MKVYMNLFLFVGTADVTDVLHQGREKKGGKDRQETNRNCDKGRCPKKEQFTNKSPSSAF